VIFCSIVVYLRCRKHNVFRPLQGFQRYDPIPQDEDSLPFIQPKTLRNSHLLPSDSDNDNDEVVLLSTSSDKNIFSQS